MTPINSWKLLVRGVACGITLSSLVGCSTRVADLTLVSTRNIDLSNAKLDVRQGVRAKGEDCVYWPLGLIPTGYPNLENAVDRALESGRGNLMVDQVTYSSGYYVILFAVQCLSVEGTVLQTAAGSGAPH
jgi:hypothetical protein